MGAGPMSSGPVSVAVQGISTGTIILATIQILFGGGIAVAIVKAWPALKRIAADREARSAEIANEREANLLTERAEEMKEMRAQIAALEAERQIDRHRINNLTQCLDALLMLIEQDPSKAAAAATRIKGMRADQMAAEAAEKGAVAAGKVKEATAP